MGLGWLLEAREVRGNVALEQSSKSTKYEIEGSYNDPVHEHVSVLKTAKLPQECNGDTDFIEVGVGKLECYTLIISPCLSCSPCLSTQSAPQNTQNDTAGTLLGG